MSGLPGDPNRDAAIDYTSRNGQATEDRAHEIAMEMAEKILASKHDIADLVSDAEPDIWDDMRIIVQHAQAALNAIGKGLEAHQTPELEVLRAAGRLEKTLRHAAYQVAIDDAIDQATEELGGE